MSCMYTSASNVIDTITLTMTTQPWIAPRPFSYNGRTYRSLLEARWSAFCDIVGWRREFEPFNGDGYIPDLLVFGESPFLIEVKPAVTSQDYWAPVDKSVTGVRNIWRHDLVFLGVHPVATDTLGSVCCGYPTAGLIGEGTGFLPNEWSMGLAKWGRCATCGQVAISHDTMSYHCRPCGHYVGGRSLIPLTDDWKDVSAEKLLDKWWQQAGNLTQWNKPTVEAPPAKSIWVQSSGGELRIKFPYNDALKYAIKGVPGARWNPIDKAWAVPHYHGYHLRFALRPWVDLVDWNGEPMASPTTLFDYEDTTP